MATAQGVVDPEHGLVGVAQSLRGLGSVKRVLVIGAHPDDEDTSLLAFLVRGLGADAAYLALNRGEGGQNLIGPELGVGLGLVRAEELLAARRLDGAGQFFTRAYDFGYSKSADETFRFWPKDSLLSDVVLAIRRYRPQVVVSIFTGTTRDGHGQHQVAGILAREAFDAAGDPSRFPEQLAGGLPAWAPVKLYRSTRFDTTNTTLRIETGTLDLLLGRSYHQIAMASRSQHRSQDMGRIEPLGPRQTRVELLKSRGIADTERSEASLFDGVETSVAALLSALPDDEVRAGLEEPIEAYVDLVKNVADILNRRPAEVISHLGQALSILRRAIDLAAVAGPGAEHVHWVLRRDEAKLEVALTAAAGVIVAAFSDDDLVIPGQSLEVEVQIWNGGDGPVDIRALALETPTGWKVDRIGEVDAAVLPGTLSRRRFQVTVPLDEEQTRPYFLRARRTGAAYVWPAESPERGLPFSPPLLEARADLGIAGNVVHRSAEAVYRFADQARGEVRRPLRVVPAVSVELAPATSVWPLGRETPLDFSVSLRGEVPEGAEGRVWLELPAGWRVSPAEADFSLPGPGRAATAEFEVEPAEETEPGAYDLRAWAETADGHRYQQGYSIIDYTHIRRNLLYEEAAARIEAFELDVDQDLRVAYVPGAGDAVAEAVGAMGLRVDVLDERVLASGDLSEYDVIVLGIRAYETNPTVVASNERLLGFVRAGGTLIVQYQQYRYFRESYTPYAMRARFPHDRVSDELAPVAVLAPRHPVFHVPNRIGESDFQGWVQERGLYFPYEWDERYQALLEMADPGEEPKRGGLLVARYGEGLYVYTGLSLFRQLPAGVPGAFRLLANLLSLE
jgi:LmbE family N-acetylglucosaminyl deacetylase